MEVFIKYSVYAVIGRENSQDIFGPPFALTIRPQGFYTGFPGTTGPPGRNARAWRNQEIMKFFLCVIGMVMIIEGIPYFAFPEKVKSWLRQLLELEPRVLRAFGLVLMLAGLGLVYVGNR